VEKQRTATHATNDNIALRMRTACWIPKATDIHSEYKILVTFPPQVVMRTCLVLRLYVHCLFCSFYKPPQTRVRGLSEEAKWLGT